MKQNEFIQWLEERRGKKSIRKFAKELGISHAHVTEVLKGYKRVSWRFCAFVAETMDLPHQTVFEMAGLVPAKSQTPPEAH